MAAGPPPRAKTITKLLKHIIKIKMLTPIIEIRKYGHSRILKIFISDSTSCEVSSHISLGIDSNRLRKTLTANGMQKARCPSIIPKIPYK